MRAVPHPLQQRSAAQGLPPQAEEDTRFSVFPRLRGQVAVQHLWLADDGGFQLLQSVHGATLKFKLLCRNTVTLAGTRENLRNI